MSDIIISPGHSAQALLDDLVARAQEIASNVDSTAQESPELAEHMAFAVGAFLGFVSDYAEEPARVAELMRELMPQINDL